MKKIILTGLLGISAVMADVKTVIPYVGTVNYDSNNAKSLKDNAKFAGFYTSVGNLNYLFEFAYGYTDITYKNTTVPNLKQHDITLKYGKYYKNFAWHAGLHYVNNNEQGAIKDLGDGYIAIIGVEGYKWLDYNKLTYGIDAYYSYYTDAYTDTSLIKTTNVSLLQLSPKLTYSKAINLNTRNTVTLIANFIHAYDYQDSSYWSYEISDTLGYKKFYATLKFNAGKMRSGVKDAGFTVYNTKDLLKNAYSVKLGYYFTPKLEVNVSYIKNDYEEYDAANLALLPEGSNTIALISMSYSF
ncbi:hypothetical protein YH65_02595 [Sulfurovum lithotrophicum]|uniref:Porin domain-containing protein n=1 Tax=Sulfurovum lithotrophicum TaxID=206403 RepID=A0A7U4M061_9BACT|nr:hypothetical protein [Sulfurovum lithotrophicum]AKF24406.1 hypothetical protein YH65_02595 [Sulfurovum lithotrophicum]